MNRKDVEARLDRSLQKQVSLPKLDARFNAAVWSRIAEQEAPAAAVRRVPGSRWLRMSNALGMAVSLVLIVYFVARETAGMSVEMNLPLPAISEQTTAQITQLLGWGVTAAAVGFGFMFTDMGRRLLRFCRSEFA